MPRKRKGKKYWAQFGRCIGCVDKHSISCDNSVHHDQMFLKFCTLVISQVKLPRYRKDLHQIKKRARSVFCHQLLLVASRRATEVVFLRFFFYWFSLVQELALNGSDGLSCDSHCWQRIEIERDAGVERDHQAYRYPQHICAGSTSLGFNYHFFNDGSSATCDDKCMRDDSRINLHKRQWEN